MAIKLGITGGIGSGKSMVSYLLEIMGIPVYIADMEAKRLTTTDRQIHNELIALLGEEIYANGKLNKTLLANYLFGHPNHARNVNKIIHPLVKENFREWVNSRSNYDIVGIEAAILIEAGFASDVDYIVMIYTPLETRIERAVSRDKSSREEIMKRIESQMSDEEKKTMAHYIIINDDTQSVIAQIEALIKILRNK